MSKLVVPRLCQEFEESVVVHAIRSAFQRLGYDRPSEDQALVIRNFLAGRDVFVMLPTGSGKSLCYAAFPYVYDSLRGVAGHVDAHHTIAVVVSPLTSIMQDQTLKFTDRGLKVTFIGKEQKDTEVKAGVESGDYSLVFMSPESMLTVSRWREMFHSEIYQECMICLAVDEAHCIRTWGQTFRREFSNIGEIRSLLPKNTNILALTATANETTQKIIMESLEMCGCFVLSKLPNNTNISYVVREKPKDPLVVLQPIIDELVYKKAKADKHLIFCRTLDEASQLFQILALNLGRRNALYSQEVTTLRSNEQCQYRLCGKFDACTSTSIKRSVIESFMTKDGVLRTVVASVAFAMGLDSPNIRKVLHWGPPGDMEMYLQHTGRAGRDGEPSTAILYWNASDLGGKDVTEEMKAYCANTCECRRKMLMAHFGRPEAFTPFDKKHLCCDVCSQSCKCEPCSTNASSLLPETISIEEIADFESPAVTQSKPPSPAQCKALKKELYAYRLALCQSAESPGASLMVGVDIATGLSDELLNEIIDQAFTITDPSSLLSLGVCSIKQAQAIMKIVHTCLKC